MDNKAVAQPEGFAGGQGVFLLVGPADTEEAVVAHDPADMGVAGVAGVLEQGRAGEGAIGADRIGDVGPRGFAAELVFVNRTAGGGEVHGFAGGVRPETEAAVAFVLCAEEGGGLTADIFELEIKINVAPILADGMHDDADGFADQRLLRRVKIHPHIIHGDFRAVLVRLARDPFFVQLPGGGGHPHIQRLAADAAQRPRPENAENPAS